ncbi:MAG TPA: hypothetical protein VI548_08030 [Chitinophagaceae bacterium]|nr:hypothetical protein [Chitinophagaceae bacterium]
MKAKIREVVCGLLFTTSSIKFVYFYSMIPDYPHKLFSDERCSFSLLMETLAMDEDKFRKG